MDPGVDVMARRCELRDGAAVVATAQTNDEALRLAMQHAARLGREVVGVRGGKVVLRAWPGGRFEWV